MSSNLFLLNDFASSLSEENRENFKNASIGSEVVIETTDDSIINGTIDGFEGSDLLMNIGHKSTFAITSCSVKKILTKKNKL